MESFGARLKREREQRKITLDDIAVSTKIGTRFLVALEEEQFDQLPGGIFNKGFVRAYARHVGIDENQAVADFVAASGTSLPEVPQPDVAELEGMAVRVPEGRSSGRSGEGGIPWGIVAIVLLVIAFGFALWGFHSREKSAKPGLVAPPPASTSDLSTGKAGAEQASPAATEASAPMSSAWPAPPAGGSEAVPPAPPPAQSAGNAGVFLVLVKAREESWVAITADGKQVVEDTLTPATEKSVEARNQVVIKTGNVGALDISFNGKKLAAQGAYNQVKTLTFDPDGLRP